MREMSKGGSAATGSSPAAPTPPTPCNPSPAPHPTEQPSPPTHGEGAKRLAQPAPAVDPGSICGVLTLFGPAAGVCGLRADRCELHRPYPPQSEGARRGHAAEALAGKLAWARFTDPTSRTGAAGGGEVPPPSAPGPACVDCGFPVYPEQQAQSVLGGAPLHGGCFLARSPLLAPESPPAAGPRGGEIPSGTFEVLAFDRLARPPVHKLRCNGCGDVFLSSGDLPGSCSKCGYCQPAVAQPIPETPEHFKIRRCKTEVSGDEPEDPPRPCDTVLGSDIRCDVCGGLRCAFHCGSIDHLSGAQLISVHSVMLPGGRSLTAKLVRAATGLFWGEVRELHGSAICAIPLKVQSDTADDVMVQLHAFMDAFTTVPPLAFDPPKVTPLGNLHTTLAASGDHGDDTCSEADLFDPENWQGVAPEAMARAVALPSPGAPSTVQRRRVAGDLEAEILSWDLAWRELAELAAVDPVSIARAKALHDACVVSLLSRIGGAL